MMSKSFALSRVALFVAIGVPGSIVFAQPPGLMQSLSARFDAAARQACGDRSVSTCALVSLTSQNLVGDVNFYRAVLQVGNGPYDFIGINRVVNERHIGSPMDGRAAVFFIHGSTQTFFDSAVNQSTISQNPGIAPWLAERGIDMWGIDLRFSFVPATATQFSDLANWTFGNTVKDILLATRFARYARRMTGQHSGKLHLAGRSLGASLVYAVANAEAVLPEVEQDVADLIPIETIYKLPPTDTAGTIFACNQAAAHNAAMSNGVFYIDNRGAMAIGEAGRVNPDAASAALGLTNKQLALRTACANTFLPAFPYHTAACLLDPGGVPTAGRFSSTGLIIDALANGIPFRSRAMMRDYFAIPCATNPTSFDDHLAEIRVPSLYIGSAGGFGPSGTYTNTLLASLEKATIFIQMLPPGQATSDFGHIEALFANSAASLAWQPILDWVLHHEPVQP
jgi:hypothetical protein